MRWTSTVYCPRPKPANESWDLGVDNRPLLRLTSVRHVYIQPLPLLGYAYLNIQHQASLALVCNRPIIIESPLLRAGIAGGVQNDPGIWRYIGTCIHCKAKAPNRAHYTTVFVLPQAVVAVWQALVGIWLQRPKLDS